MYNQEGNPTPSKNDSRTFKRTRRYNNYLAETQRECDAIRKSGTFNCSHWVTFEPNGSAEIVISDINNPASYEINGNVIDINIKDGGEIDPNTKWQFTLPSNRRNLVRINDRGETEVWELEKADDIQ